MGFFIREKEIWKAVLRMRDISGRQRGNSSSWTKLHSKLNSSKLEKEVCEMIQNTVKLKPAFLDKDLVENMKLQREKFDEDQKQRDEVSE